MIEMISITDICDVIAGQSPPSATYNQNKQGLPFFQGKADFGEYFPSIRYWCSEPNKISLPNDILLSVRAPVGATNICNEKACIGRGLFALRCKEKLNYKFLIHYLRYQENQISNIGVGSTFTSITLKDLERIKIPLPPLGVQKQIAGVLDRADGVRQLRKRVIARLDDLARSLFLDMFGDPVTNPKGWEVKTLESFILFITSGARGWAKHYSNEGSLYIRIQNVKNGFLHFDDKQYVDVPDSVEAQRIKVKENDLLITITADLGRTAVVDKHTAINGAYINQHIALIRLLDLSPRFVSSYLESTGGRLQFERLDQVGVKSGLNFNSIKSLKLIIPPLKLQQQFAAQIEKIQALKQQHQKSLKQLDNLFNSLMQRAFKGELEFKS